ncbi:porin family protein [Lewinella sp. LCG006]|uniref:porin family protein n=1 Tax=Lewinella sp. LCG006 TaxID=3231911 RepID=UPI0034614F0C
MKNIIAVCGLLFFSLSLSAQNDIQFGFELSPAVSWLTTDNNKINSNGPNLGLKLGMIGEYYFRENYSFTTGIGFHFNAGGKLFYDETIDTLSIWTDANIPGDNVYEGGTDFKYSIQFVEIPFGLKLRTREFGYLKYYVEPRMTMGFRTQSKGNILNDAAVDSEEDFDIQSGVNLLNLSWGIGGGVEYTVSSSTAIIGGIAFQSGFTDLTKDKNTLLVSNGRETKEDSKGKFNSIILRLGIMF